jgi:hypothetical protein
MLPVRADSPNGRKVLLANRRGLKIASQRASDLSIFPVRWCPYGGMGTC